MDGGEKSLTSALHLLDQFSKYSGLNPNLQKTSCVWLGSKTGSEEVLCTDHNLSWTNEPFVLLGIKFSTNIQDIPDINFGDRLGEIKKIISAWSKRQLSPLGKIVVIKSIILPKLTHLFVSLPKPSFDWLKELEKILYQFIWDHNDRIQRCQLIQDYSMGGLRMIHIESFIDSMKLSWIQRLLFGGNTLWAKLYEHLIPDRYKESFLNFGNEYLTWIILLINNPFWKEVFESLHKFRKIFEGDRQETTSHPIWYNNNIKIGEECVFFLNWYQRGIRSISDLLGQDGRFVGYEELCRMYNFRPIITRFYGLRCAILKCYPWLRAVDHIPMRPACPKYLYSILNNGKRGKKMYDFFIESLQKEQQFKNKWAFELNLQMEDRDWKQINSAVKPLGEIQLQWFQYRILHRILGTKSFLHKVGIADSPFCTFCDQMPETIMHLFGECPVVERLIVEVKTWFSEIYEIEFDISRSNFILGVPLKKDETLNMVLTILKYYIYKQKMKNCRLSLIGYKKNLIYYYKLEHYLSKKNSTEARHQKRWELFHVHLSEGVNLQ